MSKAVATRSGNKTFFQNYVNKNQLNVGIYKLVPETPNAPTHLEDFSDFSLPNKLYGESLDYMTQKVLRSFKELNKSVGVLLSGLKGTGKSLQLKHIAMNSNMPVLIVDEFISGTELITFLEKSPTSCVILFDEFEKVYSKGEQQETILPLLDGLSSTPHIFILTVNNSVSEFLVGRPSRIRYNKKYFGLDESLIKEIAEDLLTDKSKLEEVTSLLCMMHDVNMDMVVSFIQDVNLFPDEQPEQIIKTFNLEDPLSGEFKIVFETPGLVTLKSDKSSEIQSKVVTYLSNKYSFARLNFLEQFYDVKHKQRNLAIMKELVQEFPGEIDIKMLSAATECTNLTEFLNELSSEGEIYLSKYYGSSEYITDDCMFEKISGNFLRSFGSLFIKKNKKNDIEIHSESQLIAVASRQTKFLFR